MTNKKLNVLKDEKPKSLVLKIVELFESRAGFTSVPHKVTETLDADLVEVIVTMRMLENKYTRILYSSGNKREIYGLNPPHLWKKTIPEAEKLIREYL